MKLLSIPISIIFIPVVLLFSFLLNIFGISFTHKLGLAFGLFLYSIGFRRDTVHKNIENAFSGEKSAEEIKNLERLSYINFGRQSMDILRIMTCSQSQLEKQVKFSEEAKNKIMQAYQTADKGIIILVCHTGNYEIIGNIMSMLSLEIYGAVKRQTNFLAQCLIAWRRKRTNLNVLYPSEGILQKVKQAIQQKKVVLFAIDQHFPGKSAIHVNFFGNPCTISRKIADFIQKNEIRTIAACNFYGPQGNVFVEVMSECPGESPYPNSQDMTNMIEKLIRKHPEQWLWMHRRWKDDETYT